MDVNGSGDLPVPEHPVVAGDDLASVWRSRWTAAVRACERHGGTGSIRIGHALEASELAAIEKELAFALPGSLANLFTRIAADVDVSWSLPGTSEPPAPFRQLFSGGCAWDARRLLELERSRLDWIEGCFANRDDEYDRVWHDKLAIMDVPNGDLIALDVSRTDRAPVVYLSHDDGEGHGRVLGHSVLDFIDRWTLLGCPGPEEWQMTPFLHADRPYIDATGEAARGWRAWFGLELE